MNHLVQVPSTPDPPAGRSDAELVVNVALGVLGASVGVGRAVVRRTAESPAVRTVVTWHPPFVPDRYQPATLLARAARRGARQRAWAVVEVQRLLDQWTPVIVEMVVSRLDLTGLVIHNVDLDGVVATVDLDSAVARVDIESIVQRLDLDAIVSTVDLNAAVEGVDIDAIAARLDIVAVIDRVDIVAMVEEVIAAIDLPAIIRDSSGSMASETVRSARMTSISADEAISRTIERHLFRRRRAATTTDTP
jgi:hypothetical protein